MKIIRRIMAQEKSNPISRSTSPLSPPPHMSGDLIESVKTGIYISDTNGKITYANQAFAELLGYAQKEDLLGLNISQTLYTNSQDREACLNKMQAKGFVLNYEINRTGQDGAPAILSATSNFIKDDRGEVLGVEGVIEDVTQRKKLERELRTEKTRLEQILDVDEKISPGLEIDRIIDLVVGEVTQILGAERCSIMFIDEDSQELVIKGSKGLGEEHIHNNRIKLGSSISGIIAKEGKPVLVRDIEATHYPKKKHHSYKTRSFMSVPVKIKNRVVGLVNVSDKISQDEDYFTPLDLKILSAIVRQTAVTMENASLHRELSYLSIYDPSTKLYNHRYFIQCLDQQISYFRRYGIPLVMVFISMDPSGNKKNVDSSESQEDALKMIAHELRSCLREVDVMARYAADQLAVLLPHTTTNQAQHVVKRLQKIFDSTILHSSWDLKIGACEYADSLDRYEFLLKAEQALREAKKENKKGSIAKY